MGHFSYVNLFFNGGMVRVGVYRIVRQLSAKLLLKYLKMDDKRLYRLISQHRNAPVMDMLQHIYYEDAVQFGKNYFNASKKASRSVLMDVIWEVGNNVSIGKYAPQDFDLDFIIKQLMLKRFISYKKRQLGKA